MADTRIIDLPNQVTIGEGSFVAVDSDSDGTRKYDLAQIASVADANVIASMAERAAQIATEAAERRIDDAIDAMGDISEIAVPLMSSDVRGGAKLGEGLALTDGALGIDPASHESTGEVRGSIAALTAKGHAEQDGTPTPDAPVEIQMTRGRNLLQGALVNGLYNGNNGSEISSESYMRTGKVSVKPSTTYSISLQKSKTASVLYRYEWTIDGTFVGRTPMSGNTTKSISMTFATGSTTALVAFSCGSNNDAEQDGSVTNVQLELSSHATPYVPYGHVGMEARQGSTLLSTTPIPLPSRGWVGSLPDGTADVLALDGAGKVEWELADAETTTAVTDGVTGTVGVDVLSTTGQIADGATVLYKLATPATEECGYADIPAIPGTATVSIPELDALGVRYLIGDSVREMAEQWYARARSEYEDRIATLEEAVAQIIAS